MTISDFKFESTKDGVGVSAVVNGVGIGRIVHRKTWDENPEKSAQMLVEGFVGLLQKACKGGA